MGLSCRTLRRTVTALGNLFLAFSLACFVLFTISLAFSAVPSLFFLVRYFLRAIHWSLCWKTRRVSTKPLSPGSFCPGLLTFFKGFVTKYWQASSSLERLESVWILLAFLGSQHRGLCLCVYGGGACVKVRGHHLQASFLRCPPLCFLEQGISLVLCLASKLSRLARECIIRSTSVSTSPGRDYKHTPQSLVFFMVIGIKPRSHDCKACPFLSYFPSPVFYISDSRLRKSK